MPEIRFLAPLLGIAGMLTPPIAAHGFASVCGRTAFQLASACFLEASEDRKVTEAVCLNLTDGDARVECREEAEEALAEARGECRAQTRTRLALCRVPGFAGAYDPAIEPSDFVQGIDNPYAPFAMGSRWVYEKQTEEGTEVVQIEVLPETREILGVECTSVRDRVLLDGELVEDTVDWVAQDVHGNVWYFGEIARNYEDGFLVDLDGSWVAGEDGAKPGFWVKAAPVEGELYRQEWLPGAAEDVVEVLDLDAEEPVPFANGGPVAKTRDFTPIEPGVFELKFYVPGVGLVLEVDPESGERLELVDYTP